MSSNNLISRVRNWSGEEYFRQDTHPTSISHPWKWRYCMDIIRIFELCRRVAFCQLQFHIFVVGATLGDLQLSNWHRITKQSPIEQKDAQPSVPSLRLPRGSHDDRTAICFSTSAWSGVFQRLWLHQSASYISHSRPQWVRTCLQSWRSRHRVRRYNGRNMCGGDFYGGGFILQNWGMQGSRPGSCIVKSRGKQSWKPLK